MSAVAVPGGYTGRVLWVDLTTGTLEVESPPVGALREYLGGYGLGVRLIYPLLKPGCDPLGPENILGVATGPLTGTPAIIGSRFAVMGKSPLTDTWGDANCGGQFGPALKGAGYDAVFFTGQSERPVYLLLDSGRAELRGASSLWGRDTATTAQLLKDTLGEKTQVACIGPAGEKLSLLACVMNDRGRAAGRSGLGAVMGSKSLKAIAVLGDAKTRLADGDRARQLRQEYLKALVGPAVESLRRYGTCADMARSVSKGDAPVKNWAVAGLDQFPGADKVSGDAVIAYQTRRYGCWHCPISCGGLVNVPQGPYAGEGHKPEYETLAAFGSNCLNDNLESIVRLNEICNRYGMDTISAGSSIAFAMECYEKGLISRNDTDGLDLRWGNAEAMVAMTERMGRREGFGEVLADGVKRASERIGGASSEFAVHVQGQEPAMHDPRYTPGFATTYVLDATPGRHTQGGSAYGRLPGAQVPVPRRMEYSGKAEAQRFLGNLFHVVNSAGLCTFGTMCIDVNSVSQFLSAVTGWDITMEECLETGERIGALRHLFNLREGLNPLGYRLPGRMVGRPPLAEGPLAGVTVDLDTMVQEYLGLMGWDQRTAWPGRERLEALGLDFALAGLAPRYESEDR
ncbi:MAG: aldehyde ferredoxin oxidoreductase family protein [Dehalococcoidia bacterium]|nr:aldehyde ferredoxin oxidoreductase family protein [Dehalococcoidia bacterium]